MNTMPMEDFKFELDQMVQELQNSFVSKLTVLENEEAVIANKQSEISTIGSKIYIFQDCSDNAIHTSKTMPVFRKEFEIIRHKIKEL